MSESYRVSNQERYLLINARSLEALQEFAKGRADVEELHLRQYDSEGLLYDGSLSLFLEDTKESEAE